MKKIFVLAIVGTSLIACNDNRTPSINEDTRDTTTVVTPETPPPAYSVYTPVEGDVTYRDHKLLVMKNGQWVETDKEVKLDNGIVVYENGKAKKDGKEIVIEDGYVVTKEGNFFDKAGQKIENAWDATKEGVKKAGNEIEEGAKKVGEKAKDAVDDDDKDNK